MLFECRKQETVKISYRIINSPSVNITKYDLEEEVKNWIPNHQNNRTSATTKIIISEAR
jgi:hypothetical protein